VGERLLIHTADAYFEYGILGISVVVLLIASATLISFILKDKKNQKQLADAITKTATNQEKFVVMYQESQKQHKEIVAILNETLEIERKNTKECYVNVANKLDALHHKHDRIVDLIKK